MMKIPGDRGQILQCVCVTLYKSVDVFIFLSVPLFLKQWCVWVIKEGAELLFSCSSLWWHLSFFLTTALWTLCGSVLESFPKHCYAISRTFIILPQTFFLIPPKQTPPVILMWSNHFLFQLYFSFILRNITFFSHCILPRSLSSTHTPSSPTDPSF